MNENNPTQGSWTAPNIPDNYKYPSSIHILATTVYGSMSSIKAIIFFLWPYVSQVQLMVYLTFSLTCVSISFVLFGTHVSITCLYM